MYLATLSLDESWDGLICAMEAMAETDLTLEFVTGKLLQAWEARQEQEIK